MQRKFIICDPKKCTGCGICELACSEIKEKSFNKLFSRIHTVRIKSISEPISSMAIACFLCEDPACVKVCPRKSISVDEATGRILVKHDWASPNGCNVPCGWCIVACEFGALSLHPRWKFSMVCDQCHEEDEPACVKFCPKDALSLATIEEIILESESEFAKNILKELSCARAESKTFYERFGFIPMPPKEKRKP